MPTSSWMRAAARSKLPQWLGDIGYEHPEEEMVNGFLGYASRIYEGGPDIEQARQDYLRPGGTPGRDPRRPGAADRARPVMVTLLGLGRDYPPVDEAGFLDFARQPEKSIGVRVSPQRQPLTPIAGARQTENRWRHFERLGRWPNGLVALGDAVCAFNPVYGQGMTTAALGALTLDRYLRARRRSFEKKFQKALAQVVKRLDAGHQRRLSRPWNGGWLT